jgi:hypothetical protein
MYVKSSIGHLFGLIDAVLRYIFLSTIYSAVLVSDSVTSNPDMWNGAGEIFITSSVLGCPI